MKRIEQIPLNRWGFRRLKNAAKKGEKRVFEIRLGDKRAYKSLTRVFFTPDKYERRFGEYLHGQIVDANGDPVARAVIIQRGSQIRDRYLRRILFGGTEIAKGIMGEDDITLALVPDASPKTNVEMLFNYRNEISLLAYFSKLLNRRERDKIGPLYVENVRGWPIDAPEMKKTVLGRLWMVLRGEAPPNILWLGNLAESIGPYEEELIYRWDFWRGTKWREKRRLTRISSIAGRRISSNVVRKIDWIDRHPLNNVELTAATINVLEARVGAAKAFMYGYTKRVVEPKYGKSDDAVTEKLVERAERRIKAIIGNEKDKNIGIAKPLAMGGLTAAIYAYAMRPKGEITAPRPPEPVTVNTSELIGKTASAEHVGAAIAAAVAGTIAAAKLHEKISERFAYRRTLRKIRNKDLGEEEIAELVRNAKVLIHSNRPKLRGVARAILELLDAEKR